MGKNDVFYINYGDNSLEIEYEYFYDPGVWRYPDGSGQPPTGELNITKITVFDSESNSVDITDFMYECCDYMIDVWVEKIYNNMD